MALMDALEWRQARQWLIASEVIPATHRVTKPDVDLIDFARSLRDGTFLCSLLLKLKSDCIEDWTPKPIMQHHYLKNISAFLQACSSRFGMKEGDLFTESDLYNVDNFQKVMRCLSKLSHTPEALSLALVPFPREETRDYYNQVNSDDIYASLRDIGMANDARDRLYANVGELYAQEDPYGYGDESIYDSICYYQAPPVKTTDADEKKKYVLQELFETERSFVTVLTLINNDFYSTLHDVLSAEDTDLLFSTAKLLLPVHHTLLEGFEKCVDSWGKADISKTDISRYFLDSQTGLLQYGIYAARLPMAVQKAKHLQTRGETSRMLQVCQEHSNQRFPLSDLLNVPIQRFLKYPLLVKELKKVAPRCAMASQIEVTNLETVFNLLEDIARYINASKGDYEGMQQIEEVEQSLTDYVGPPLLQCGRYHLDGELRFKATDSGTGIKPNPRWVFLFDKVMLVCKKVNMRMGFTVRYSPKFTLPVSSIKVDTLPVHRGGKRVQFSYGFQVSTPDHGNFTVFAKTEELKSQWIDAINHAKEMCAPRDGRKGLHMFELHTFDQPCYCDVCKKLLHGCYYQGYHCQQCQRAAHRDCLKDIERCNTFQPMPAPANHRRVGPRSSSEFQIGAGLATSASTSSLAGSRPGGIGGGRRPGTMTQNGLGTIFIAKQRYDAIGNRSTRVLSFERGEELEVAHPSPALEWWEAISLKTGNKGEVPPSYLIRKGMHLDDTLGGGSGSYSEDIASISPGRLDDRLRGYPWYLGKKSRIEAEQALHRMRDGVFLIRESDVRPGEYAIALKWKRMPKHIKVCKHPDTRKFYVSDVCEFFSVAELVNYYQQTSLGASFPGVDTTLKYPYKDMVEGGGATGGGGVSTISMPPEQPKKRSMSQPPPPSLPSPLPQTTSGNAGEGWAEVLFRFTAEFQDELTIERHERIKILRKMTDKSGWWLGEAPNGQTGLFPSNYVKEID